MSSLLKKYCTLFENDFMFSKIVKIYLICNHNDESIIHYNNLCTDNVTGAILIQPNESEYLKDCTIDDNNWVYLNTNINCLNHNHKLKTRKFIINYYKHRCGNKKINCNFVRISLNNMYEIIEILYNIVCDLNYFIEYDNDYVNYTSKIKYARNSFKRFKLSLS